MKHKKIWIFVGIIVLILVLNHIFGWSHYLSDPDNLDFLKTMVKDNFWMAALIYSGITIVSCVVLALPGVTFAILAGLIFGPVMGTVLCCVATTLGAMIAFLVGRYFLQDAIRPKASENKYLKKWLFDESGRNEMFILMITRLVPVFPYNLQNFAYGITDIGFIEYSVGSFLFMIPGTAMYTIGTAGLADPRNRWLYIGIALVIAVVVVAVGLILKKKYVQPEGGKKKMSDQERTLDTDRCVRCGKCREECLFLTKYNLVIGDTDKLKGLAYHCFLCGRCTRVCPVNIDGRQVILNFREEKAAQEEKKIKKDYRGLVWEKNHYKYRNYKKAAPKDRSVHSVYFPGCNFPSLFPKTNAYLSKLLYEEAGIGTAYDCCGKPIAELGLEKDARRITKEITENLKKAGVSEIVTACPNCFYHLTPRCSLKVTSIYDKLKELGIGGKIERDLHFFLPCPDRESRAWLRSISGFVNGEIIVEREPQCCGLGGSGGVCEPDLAEQMASSFTGREGGIDTCCASCTGRFTRSGAEMHHILPEILGIQESPDTSKSYLNRVRTKWK